MKTQLFCLLALGMIAVLSGCPEPPAAVNDLFILPDGDSCAVCRLVDDSITTLHTLPFPGDQAFEPGVRIRSQYDSLRHRAKAYDRIDYTQDWIIFITSSRDTIMVYAGHTLTAPMRRHDIVLPDNYEVRSFAISGDILYVGGVCEQEIIGYYDLAADSAAWVTLPVPDSLKAFGKHIDGLCIRDRNLIAVDDLIFPKWMIVYDIADPRKPVIDEIKSLSNHGVYEGIVEVAQGDNWMAALSLTSGKVGIGQHIALFDWPDLLERGVVSNHVGAHRLTGYSDVNIDTLLSWESIAFLDNYLLIAGGSKGMAVIDMNVTVLGVAERLQQPVVHRKQPAHPDDAFLDFMNVAPLGKIAAIVARGDRLETVLLRINDLLDTEQWIPVDTVDGSRH